MFEFNDPLDCFGKNRVDQKVPNAARRVSNMAIGCLLCCSFPLILVRPAGLCCVIACSGKLKRKALYWEDLSNKTSGQPNKYMFFWFSFFTTQCVGDKQDYSKRRQLCPEGNNFQFTGNTFMKYSLHLKVLWEICSAVYSFHRNVRSNCREMRINLLVSLIEGEVSREAVTPGTERHPTTGPFVHVLVGGCPHLEALRRCPCGFPASQHGAFCWFLLDFQLRGSSLTDATIEVWREGGREEGLSLLIDQIAVKLKCVRINSQTPRPPCCLSAFFIAASQPPCGVDELRLSRHSSPLRPESAAERLKRDCPWKLEDLLPILVGETHHCVHTAWWETWWELLIY